MSAAGSDGPLDVVGIGNAIVDVFARTDDAFLETHGLAKGSMNLIEPDRAEWLYGEMGPAVEVSGGSAANTVAGVAALGGRAGFVGKVADDQLGTIYAHDIRSVGVEFTTPFSTGAEPTARSYILITPDGERTMNTYLGACQTLSPDDVDEDQIARAAITYLEGYLWDPPGAKEAFLRAIDIAHKANRKIALTLSDLFCVDRYRDEFLHLLDNHVDILFANEDELKSLYGMDDTEAAVERMRKDADIAAITRSARGSTILSNGDRHDIAAVATTVEDTTGAGDLYAAGFLFGLSHELPIPQCGEIASACAGEIISHVGARPEGDLKEVVGNITG